MKARLSSTFAVWLLAGCGDTDSARPPEAGGFAIADGSRSFEAAPDASEGASGAASQDGQVATHDSAIVETPMDAGADASSDGGGGSACQGMTVCTADYPCMGLTSGYTCLGQFADWPPSDSPTTLSDNGDGTVTDSRNHLVWQQAVDAGSYTWAAAKTYCADLWLAGSGDWRLPTKAELESIVDFTKASPAIDPTVFPDTPDDDFWSSSAGTSADHPWHVRFYNGQSNTGPAAETYRVRCVRSSAVVVPAAGIGGAPPGRYTVSDEGTGVLSDDTVKDNRTGLTWQREVDGVAYTQDAAKDYCESLSLAGGGWRLPRVSELRTLTDPTKWSPAIDSIVFPAVSLANFWSSSAFVYVAGKAWHVNFSDGNSWYGDLTNPYRVRCVR